MGVMIFYKTACSIKMKIVFNKFNIISDFVNVWLTFSDEIPVFIIGYK